MSIDEANLYRARPAGTRGAPTGALILAGSSGRIDTARADLLADHGVTALAIRWFGGPGLPPAPREVPLELFVEAIGVLQRECDRVVLIGLSYGAEAALLTASVDRRVDGVVALAPTDVAWEGQIDHDDDPPTSKWTLRGEPVRFVPLDRTWRPEGDPPSFREHYQRSRALAGPETLEAARIRVESIPGDLVLVAGGDDRVWDGAGAARRIAARRAGLGTTVVVDEAAGHPVVLPGETAPDPRRPYRVGGDPGAPQRLGRKAWPEIARLLRIRDPG